MLVCPDLIGRAFFVLFVLRELDVHSNCMELAVDYHNRWDTKLTQVSSPILSNLL